MTSSTGNGNYAATWLNSTIAGLTGTATLGTLTVTIPANAPSSAAYAIHFDHASASPNGIASFPKTDPHGPDSAVQIVPAPPIATASPIPGGSVTSAR